MVDLTREQQLVLACMRPTVEEARRLLQEGVDWNRLLQVAQQHNVLVPATRRLGEYFTELLPAAVARHVKQIGEDAIFRNLRMAWQLDEVVRRFESEQIPVLVLKGLPLGVLLYGSTMLRQTGDIDLMARPQDAKRAWRILGEQGFQPVCALDERQEEALIRGGHAFDFGPSSGKIMVDLHWGIQRYVCPLDVRKVWARAQEVTVEGRVYWTLSWEDYLLFLCYHPVKHGYRELRAVCDIAALLQSAAKLDWDYVQQEAEKAGCRRMLWLGVGLAQMLLGAPLPAKIPGDPKIERLVSLAHESLFGPHRAFRDSPTMWGTRVLDTPQRKAAFLLRKIFVPNEDDFAIWSLPQGMFFAYYGLRFVRLPWRYARIVGHLRRC